MENKNKSSIFKEITAVKNPYCVRYLAKDRIVIAGENGCSTVNPITNEVIKKLDNFNYYDRAQLSDVIVSPDKKRTISFYDERLIVDNIETGNREYNIGVTYYIQSLICSPFEDNTIFVCYKNRKEITKYNYATDQAKNILVTGVGGYSGLAMHPKKEMLCILDGNLHTISIHALDNLALKFKINLCEWGLFCCQYSPDGSFIIVGGPKKIFIIDANNKNERHSCLRHGKDGMLDGRFNGMAFHPNSLVLATVSRATTSVCYWDVKTQELVGITELDIKGAHDLVFSDDGLQSIVALENKCLVIPTPFKVLWRNRYPYFLFLLKNYLNQHYEMPQDIATYVMKIAYEI